ncbi:LamNT [Nesidiocoris tenuis]|uniref:LamNT n=1 Tax=Nesidiocoris tenuis TaxID=355587 RepID=A0ABN7AGE3_9HEMI|nr:LamNT [Nesidiocoris tenuis]
MGLPRYLRNVGGPRPYPDHVGSLPPTHPPVLSLCCTTAHLQEHEIPVSQSPALGSNAFRVFPSAGPALAFTKQCIQRALLPRRPSIPRRPKCQQPGNTRRNGAALRTKVASPARPVTHHGRLRGSTEDLSTNWAGAVYGGKQKSNTVCSSRVLASSTCGLRREEYFCRVSYVEEQAKCFRCDSRPNAPIELSHRVENVIHRHHTAYNRTNKVSWWQSENGKENVTIQLDLEAEFHFTHLIMRFHYFRPASMIVERSYDFGKTWKVYRYLAHNCNASFPHVKLHKPDRDRPFEPFCDSTYSAPTPVTDGEVILRVLTPGFRAKYDLYSDELQDLMKMTNLRIVFTKLHTLGDDHLDSRKEIQEKYYYAISEMNVRGSCWCYGHAEKCLPLDNTINDVDEMVHGRCDCSHNTTGPNCKSCKDTHNDIPWKPATGPHTNACKRCRCNEHALRCRFNETLYEKSGRTSGSECIDCQHNTIGNNCELCLPTFYHDPSKPITDIDTCLECNCYYEGTVDNGLCDPPLVYGDPPKCHCKSKVTGPSCDQCIPGYWKLDELNPEGCTACTCNLNGTVSETCDQDQGTCYCKPNVIGKDCDRCAPEHWGLSENSYGCQPCDCNHGGSMDNNCDPASGQCKCFKNIGGRRCDTPDQGYYVKSLDLVYEAEDAKCTGVCMVDVHEFPKNRTPTWTGRGYMRVYDTSTLEFEIDDLPKSMNYQMIVRYDKVPRHGTVECTATIERIDGMDDTCSNASPTEVYKYQLQSGSIYAISDDSTPLCLEEGKLYKVTLTFKTDYNQVDSTPSPILIDSIVLIPDPTDFWPSDPESQRRREDYEYLNCEEIFYSPVKIAIPEECKHYHYSISVYVNKGAEECKCNPTGSRSQFCEGNGGKCECKNKVVGRTCDKCAEGTYGFDFPDGCVDCDCNGIGAIDNICDPTTGQCTCRNGTYGRTCDQCQPGSWGFPKCRPCQCNGFAHTCDSKTGECIDCRDHTSGYSCDKCEQGYYGDPSTGLHCRPCKCPDTAESGQSFASGCILENDNVQCLCEEGYAGARCDKCAENYFGNPEKPGGSCKHCNCSGNVDESEPGACDTVTGKCLKCLGDTTGNNCEQCRPGYYGDALMHNCTECLCDPLGHNKELGECNPTTGECPCKTNVEGRQCDQCKPGTKLIATGEGCKPCDCDLIGSRSTTCNEYTGECECREGFGGFQCNECQANFWGDPNTECFPCDCSTEGSVNGTCHQSNGTCICKEGIGGEKCDKCARGYFGTSPNCVKCVECFDNWDKIIEDLSEKTNEVIHSASEIRRTGTSGYGDKFDNLLKKIDDVNTTLINADENKKLLDVLNKEVDNLKGRLNTSIEKVSNLNSDVEDVLSKLSFATIYLNKTNDEANELRIRAHQLTNNATNLQEKDLKGALNLTREAGEESKVVAKIENEILPKLLQDAEKKCKGTETLIYRDNETFIQTEQAHDTDRGNLEFKLSGLEKQIPQLNKQICDGSGEQCDSLCGGAGCGYCGSKSISCENGAVGKAAAGLNLATLYASQITNKLRKAELTNREMSIAKQKMEDANLAAQDAYSVANLLKSKFENIVNSLNDMNKKLTAFISGNQATPDEIITVVNQTLNMNLNREPAMIEALAKQINNTNDSLTNVTAILDDTKEDRETADQLKMESDDAKIRAESVLEKAQKVVEGLNAAEAAQIRAEGEIQTANNDIGEINKQLSQVMSETTDADSKVNQTKQEIESIKSLLKALQTTVLQNKHGADQVKSEASLISQQVNSTKTKSDDLKEQYNKVRSQIANREQVSEKSKSRAQKLLGDARRLSVHTKTKQNELQEVNGAYSQQESKLRDLETNIDALTLVIETYINKIEEKDKFYRSCDV